MKSSFALFALSFTIASCSQAQPSPTTDVTAAPSAALGPRPPLYAVPIDGLPTLGDDDALVTLVELTDYECPYCARAETTIAALRDHYGHDLRIAIAETPLAIHPHARDAALFALAANARGRFAAVHPRLFDTKAHDATALSELALSLSLDPSLAAPNGADGDAAHLALARSEALAAKLHVRGTPTFFVNGVKIVGAQPESTFTAAIDAALAHARALVASGVARRDVYGAILAEAAQNPAPFENEAPPQSPETIAAARATTGAPFLGAPTAPHVILVFTDFACPFCAKLDERLRELVAGHSDVRVVLRHSPLPMHESAPLAAKAAIAAANQGALERYAARMFAHQGAPDRQSLLAYADEEHLDRTTFVRDLDAAETAARLADDLVAAKRLGVRGTPTSFVDGRRIDGAQSEGAFLEAMKVEAMGR